MHNRLAAFSQLASSYLENSLIPGHLLSLACEDISSQCGFEISGDNVDFLICIDQLVVSNIITAENILSRTSLFLPKEIYSKLIDYYSQIHHIWFEFDSTSGYDLGGIFISFKEYVHGYDKYSKIIAMMDIFGISYTSFDKGLTQLQSVFNDDSITLTELGYMPGRNNCPIRLCFYTGSIEKTESVFSNLFPNHPIFFDNFLKSSPKNQLVEHYFIDVDLYESSIEFNGIEVFPLATKSFVPSMFNNLDIHSEKIVNTFKPHALQLIRPATIYKNFDNEKSNYILRRCLNHVKYTAKTHLKEAKFYVSLEYLYIRSEVKKYEKEFSSRTTSFKHFDEWTVLHQANNLEYLSRSRAFHSLLLESYSKNTNIRTIKDGSLWEVNDWISDNDVMAAYKSCLQCHSWSFSNKGNDRQIVPSWWITKSFTSEILSIVNSIKAKFLKSSDTNFASRVIVNGHTSGFSDYKHQDLDFFAQGLTFLVFLNPNWNTEYDGEFKIYYEDSTSISILPSSGKLLIFDGSIPHRASSVSREFSGLRLSLALQYNSIADSGKMLSHF